MKPWEPVADDLPEALARVLPLVEKPARYIGGEFNSVHKPWDSVSCRIALAFPDVYEIGMSFLGFRILYDVVNRDPRFLAERAYSPWTDMEAVMRRDRIPAHTLESFRPLSDFDVVGFTLQTEAAYTNILTQIDLGGITLQAKDRRDEEPLILAGGPCAFNPEPLADFLDAVLLGDGEEALIEILGILAELPKDRTTRLERLRAIQKVKGVYIPSFYRVEYRPDGLLASVAPNRGEAPTRVSRRLLDDLDRAAMPVRPLLPTMDIVHDRIQLEAFRGCSRGCRFCQAGMTYRPVRERSVEALVRGAEDAVRNSGYEEMSLVSLSTGDYTSLEPLVRRLTDEFTSRNVSISTGSLRVDSRFDRLFGIMAGVKKSGFTFAPEAGSDRLRKVINKNITSDDILLTARKVFTQGWDLLKLYFMFGLPTETDEDLQALVDTVAQVQRVGREAGGHRKQVNVSAGCFVPKPFTPFQWCAQDDRETIARKNEWLSKRLRYPRREMNERLAKLEALLALGDRRVGAVILAAWRKGARFDGWSDGFRPNLWDEACAEVGLEPRFYTDRPKGREEVLPWDHLFAEMDKDFLWEEWEKAQRAEQSGDCRWDACLTCGACDPKDCPAHRLKEADEIPPAPKVPTADYQAQAMRARVYFSKTGRARYLSHLAVIRVFHRALQRAGVPLSYTGGFTKRPRTVFTPPVSLGVESLCEAADLTLRERVETAHLQKALAGEMPPGFRVLGVESLPEHAPDAMNAFGEADFSILPGGEGAEKARLRSDLEAFLAKASAPVKYETEKGPREKDARAFVLSGGVEAAPEGVRVNLTLDLKSPHSLKLERLLPCVFPSFDWAGRGYRACRTALRVKTAG